MLEINWAPPSEFVSSSIPSWQISTAHAQPFRGATDLAFCLKVPLDSLLVWASSEGSGETARMRRLAWTFAARIGDKYQIRLAWPNSLLLISFITETVGQSIGALCCITNETQRCEMFRRGFTCIKPYGFHVRSLAYLLYEPPHDKSTKMIVHAAKTHLPILSDFAMRSMGSLGHKLPSCGQTGCMPRLIWVVAGRICHFVGLSLGGSYVCLTCSFTSQSTTRDMS